MRLISGYCKNSVFTFDIAHQALVKVINDSAYLLSQNL